MQTSFYANVYVYNLDSKLKVVTEEEEIFDVKIRNYYKKLINSIMDEIIHDDLEFVNGQYQLRKDKFLYKRLTVNTIIGKIIININYDTL